MSRPSVRINVPADEDPAEGNVNEHYEALMVEGLNDEDFQEIQEEEAKIPSTEPIQQDELQQDFFDQTPKEEVQYGSIEGMEVVADEEESETELKETIEEKSPTESQEDLDQSKPVRESKTVTIYIEDEKSEDDDGESILDQELKEPGALLDDRDFSTRISVDEEPKYTSKYPSVVSKGRPSINYDLRSRMLTSVVEDDMEQLFSLKQQDIILFDDIPESIEAESEATIVEEEEERFDRTPYYEQYDQLVDESFVNRRKNNILQKLVIMYLKRRKTENILKDIEPPLDQTLKYGQKLDAYHEIMDISKDQRESITAEVELLREKRNLKVEELKHAFKAMQNRESNVGHGLIYAKTGSQISDKLVDRLLRRQTILTEQVSSMRLNFIKLKDLVQEKSEKITKLDTLENNLLLADFEQLKVENRSHADKIEERDEELTRLRAKCQNTIQILAHVREKSFALDSDLYQQREAFADIDDRSRDQRENLAFLKHKRDEYRQMFRKLKDNSGLLLKPSLLIDMEESEQEFSRMQEEILACKVEVESKQNQVRKLRRIIEALKAKKKAGELKAIESFKKALKQRSSISSDSNNNKELSIVSSAEQQKPRVAKIYKKRPTMYMPVFKEDAFDGILKIQPCPRVYNKKK